MACDELIGKLIHIPLPLSGIIIQFVGKIVGCALVVFGNLTTSATNGSVSIPFWNKLTTNTPNGSVGTSFWNAEAGR